MVDAWQGLAVQTGSHMLFSHGFDSVPFDLSAFLVADAVHRAGDEPREVRTMAVKMLGCMSLGTIKSGLGMYWDRLMGDISVERSCDPYLFLHALPDFDRACEADRELNAVSQTPQSSHEEMFGRPVGPTAAHPLGTANALMVRYSM